MTSAREIYDAALAHATGAEVVIAIAAVADWRPAESSDEGEKGATSSSSRSTPIPTCWRRSQEKARASSSASPPRPRTTSERARETAGEASRCDRRQRRRGERGFGLGENELVLLWGETGRKELGRAKKRAGGPAARRDRGDNAMLLTIDVGNTETKLGCFSGRQADAHVARHDRARRTPDEYGVFFRVLRPGTSTWPRSGRS